MRKIKYIFLIFVIVFLSWGLLKLEKLKDESQARVDLLENNSNNLKKENKMLQERIEYFENPDNLIKEVKKQTNYKNEGEKVIIITPVDNNTSSEAETSSAKSP